MKPGLGSGDVFGCCDVALLLGGRAGLADRGVPGGLELIGPWKADGDGGREDVLALPTAPLDGMTVA